MTVLSNEDKREEQLAQCICTLKSLEDGADSWYEKKTLQESRITLERIYDGRVICDGEP